MSKTLDKRIQGPANENAKFDINPMSINLTMKKLKERASIENKGECINAQRKVGNEILSEELKEGVVFKATDNSKNRDNEQVHE